MVEHGRVLITLGIEFAIMVLLSLLLLTDPERNDRTALVGVVLMIFACLVGTMAVFRGRLLSRFADFAGVCEVCKT